VIGTDVSADQISHAIPKENVEYRCSPGEDLSFLQSNSVDLITIATALHWLDTEKFFQEVQRVLKAHTGVLRLVHVTRHFADQVLKKFFFELGKLE
jgi:ubiquinone/menaquinone biosynthesis C-methylase UbiE